MVGFFVSQGPYAPPVIAKMDDNFKPGARPHSLQILTRLVSRLNALSPAALILLAASNRGTEARVGARIVRLRVLFSYV